MHIPISGPTLEGGGRRFWHLCGQPISVWFDGSRIEGMLPVICPTCRQQIWSTDVARGKLRKEHPSVHKTNGVRAG